MNVLTRAHCMVAIWAEGGRTGAENDERIAMGRAIKRIAIRA